MIVKSRKEREAETQAEGEAGSMHREPDVGLDPGTPGSRPGPKAAPNRWATRATLHLTYLNQSFPPGQRFSILVSHSNHLGPFKIHDACLDASVDQLNRNL